MERLAACDLRVTVGFVIGVDDKNVEVSTLTLDVNPDAKPADACGGSDRPRLTERDRGA
jgi:hypothetical protein